jgi:hypothetical protein
MFLWLALFRPIMRWYVVIWNSIPRDFFLAWVLYLRKAITTYNNAIGSPLVATLAYWYSWN